MKKPAKSQGGPVAAGSLPKEKPFEPEKSILNFHCDWAVYPKGGQASICYCTNQERAEMIATALTSWWKSEEGQRWLAKNLKRIG